MFHCSYPTAVVGDASHASDATFSISSNSSILPLLYAGELLAMTFKLSENDIAIEIKVRYTIKNLVGWFARLFFVLGLLG